MKFTKVIGTIDPKIVKTAEDKLSAAFTELSLGWDNKSLGSGLGGDPLLFQLLYPLPHYCDALGTQLDDMEKREKDQKERIANGEKIPDNELIPDEAKEYRRQMKGKVLRTAATNGRAYFYAPEFVIKQSKLGLRIVLAHEALHSIYMHPSRRGSRLHRLWNIACDYRVNVTIMEDLKARNVKDYPAIFTKELGEYITLEEYAAFLRDPFNPPPRLAHFNPTEHLKGQADPAYKSPYDDRPPMYYADHQLSDDMKRPENVYDYLLAQIPKCPVCGKLGKYKKPQEYKDLQKKIEEQQKKKAEEKAAKDKAEGKPDPNAPADNSGCCKDHKHSEEGEDCCDHDHSSDQGKPSKSKSNSKKGKKNSQQAGEQSGQASDQNDEQGQSGNDNDQSNEDGQGQADDGSCCGGEKGCDCPACGSGSDGDYEYVDPFGAGETLDDHIDTDVSEDELQKRMQDAAAMAKRMAGKVPAGLEDELGILGNPVIRWEDIVRQQMTKKRRGVGRADWTTPKSRPMFSGLYVPRKKDFFLNIATFVDCSGSMSCEDISFGLSQLQVIDDKSEMSITPFDTICYWDKMIKVKKCNVEELSKFRPTGRGGTMCGKIFEEYEEHCGKVDMILIISDSFIYDSELTGVKLPPKETSVLWVVTSHNPKFRPPIGKVCHLHGEKM